MPNKLGKRTVSVLVFSAIAVLATGAASATSTHLYGELLTSDQTWLLPGNVRATVDATFEVDPFDITVQGNVESGAGLGNGYLQAGDVLRYTHSFDPVASVDSIVGFSLAVGVMDDGFGDWKSEAVEIAVNEEFWRGGRATARIFGGNVTAALINGQGLLEVAIQATRGDLVVAFSLLKGVYISNDDRGGGGNVAAIPEPGAMTLFCAGVLVVGTAGRRRRTVSS